MTATRLAEFVSVLPPARRAAAAGPLRGCGECLVRPLGICAAVDETLLEELEPIGRRVIYAPRTTLFVEDDPAQAVFNVTSGILRLSRLLADGRRQVVGFALPGDFVGAAAGERYTYSADASVGTSLCRFPRSDFWAFFARDSHSLRGVGDAVMRQLELAHDQVVVLGGAAAERRLAAFLIHLRRRWRRICDTGNFLPLQMGRQDIGDFLGLNISTVSRTLTAFARERLLAIVPRGVRILNDAGLARLAD
jgi:CRP/FNR family transcriptional regulator, anaerobic regulatory protein